MIVPPLVTVLAALNLMRIVKLRDRPVAELKQCMEHLPQILRNLEVKQKVPLEQLPILNKMIQEFSTTLGNRGRILFRYSGTENLARIMVEGEDAAQIEVFTDALCKQAKVEIEQKSEALV